MNTGRGPVLFVWTVFTVGCFAQNVIPSTLPSPCEELNSSVVAQTAMGQAKEAESALSAALSNNVNGPACTGLVLSNMAVTTALSGRFADAEGFAERAVKILEGIAGPQGPALLRPLQILALARLEQGKVGKARQVFGRMQLIPAERPESRALVHGVAAILSELEGNNAAAEAEYRETLSALDQAGRGNTADAASALIALGGLYIKDGRFHAAAQILDRARSIFNAAPDTLPMDRIKVLNLRAVLHARQGDWQEAEEELQNATSIADQQTGLDPGFHSYLLTNYAKALRKNRHRHEARLVEARAAALDHRAPGLVDVTELSVLAQAGKK